MKTCPKCGQEKDVSEFTSCSKSKDGHYYCCKKCKSERSKEDPEKSRERIKQFRENNPDYYKGYYQRHTNAYKVRLQTRRARKAGLTSTLTLEQWTRILTTFNNTCAYCGVGDKKLHQDHFVPILSGGEYTHDNIIPACKSCNSSKGAKDFFVWYPKYDFYDNPRERKILRYLNYSDNIQQLSIS